MPRKGFGKKDGNKTGQQAGGRGRNQTNNCRHPSKIKEGINNAVVKESKRNHAKPMH